MLSLTVSPHIPRLDERFGLEKSAKGGRFKLNRDLAGYHLTSRADIQLEDLDPPIKITLPNPEKLRTTGDLVHFENVVFRWKKMKKNMLENVTFTVGQGGRCSFVGAVSARERRGEGGEGG